jgi:hypothetical protein
MRVSLQKGERRLKWLLIPTLRLGLNSCNNDGHLSEKNEFSYLDRKYIVINEIRKQFHTINVKC